MEGVNVYNCAQYTSTLLHQLQAVVCIHRTVSVLCFSVLSVYCLFYLT